MVDNDVKVTSVLWMIIFIAIGSIWTVVLLTMEIGIANDYVFYELQEVAEGLVDQGVIESSITDITQAGFEGFQNLMYYGDNLWFGAFLTMLVSTFMVAYKSRGQSDMEFFQFLFYGVMFFMFLFGFFETYIHWVRDEVLVGMLPNVLDYYPKLVWYLDNLGVVTLVHLFILLLISKINLNFATKKSINNREIDSVASSNEVS